MRVAMRYWLTAMSVGMLLGAAGPAHALVFKSLIIFGDSLGDSGNNAFVFDRIVAPSLPPGTLRTQTPIPSQAFIPTFPYTSNRYSNGPVWVEQLADLLGMSALASNLGGTNFAFAGARTGPLGSSFPFSLLDQVAGFLAPPGNNAPVDALYIIMGGGNDLRDILENGADPNVVIPTYVNNIRQILTRLHSEGAENFLLVNVPDVGKTPAVRSQGLGASTLASFLASQMNDALHFMLSMLPLDLLDQLVELDSFALVSDIFTNPGNYGLIDAQSACAFACIAGPDGTFFWDGIHPTTAGHRVLALAALQLIPEPPGIWLLALALVAWSVRRRIGM
jgi:outer membrane lipase/esterase